MLHLTPTLHLSAWVWKRGQEGDFSPSVAVLLQGVLFCPSEPDKTNLEFGGHEALSLSPSPPPSQFRGLSPLVGQQGMSADPAHPRPPSCPAWRDRTRAFCTLAMMENSLWEGRPRDTAGAWGVLQQHSLCGDCTIQPGLGFPVSISHPTNPGPLCTSPSPQGGGPASSERSRPTRSKRCLPLQERAVVGSLLVPRASHLSHGKI